VTQRGSATFVRERLVPVFVLVLALALASTLALGAAACGGGDDGTATDTTTTEPTNGGDDAFAAGRTVFIAECGACHTLEEADTTGTTGPSLDGTALTAATIEQQVRTGSGVMPAFEGDLSDEEIANVSAYVDEAAG
jgi:mono/diheme cytochrome c family protein